MAKDDPRMTISIRKEDMKQLKKLSGKECRSYSSQIIYMMRFYIEYKEKEKYEKKVRS